jgi:ribosomal protein S6--L-glutamate ligase
VSRAALANLARTGAERVPAVARRPRCGVVVEHRYLTQAQPAGMTAALAEYGGEVVVIDPDERPADVRDARWLEDVDLVVCRGRSFALFCALAAAEHRGIPTINRRGAIAGVHNKAEMAIALAAAGVPTPKTFLALPHVLAAEIPSECYPIILKPSFGDNCQGLRIVAQPDELAGLVWPEPLVLAQEYLASDGNDLKLYVIGEDVWAVRKPSPLHAARNGSAGGLELVECTGELRALARRCGDLFGLELYGVDCLESRGGTLVIEVNDFPNYTGVPGAGDKLAGYALARAREAR